MEPLVTQFIAHVAQCFMAASADNFVSSIPLSDTHPYFQPLRQNLSSTSIELLSNEKISPRLVMVPKDARDNVAGLLSAILKNVRGGQGASDEAENAYEDFIRLQQVYSEANKVFATSNADGVYPYTFLNSFILSLAHTITHVSDRAAALSPYPPRSSKSSRSIKDATRQVIERSMQIVTAPMTDTEWRDAISQPNLAGDIIWPLANILFRIYSSRKLHTQSTDLQKTLHNLTPHEEKRFASRGSFVKATDVCQSYYWRGKLGVVLLDIRGASFWLKKALMICPEDQSSWRQKRSILTRLIPVNLLLGHLPSSGVLENYNLPQFYPLIHAFKTGNVPLWRRCLDEEREWFRRRSIWLVLFERGEILVWRNLFRLSLQIHYRTDPKAIQNRCPTWIFLAAAIQAFRGSGEVEDGAFAMEDLIVVIASLIDQSLILGHMSYSHKQLVMKPAPDGFGGFPKISAVVPRRVEAVQ